jgi:hypothetical protein
VARTGRRQDGGRDVDVGCGGGEAAGAAGGRGRGDGSVPGGRQIRLLRERAGLTQRELGERLAYGEDLISSLERGRRTPQPEFLDAADELLGAGG